MLTKLHALKNHAGFIRYSKNTSWMMGEQFLRIIAGLFVGIWVARFLGPEQFGLFSYVLAFTAIFGGIAKLGLDGIMVRELVNHPEKRDPYLGTAFWMKGIGAFIVMGLMAVIVPFTSNAATTNLYIFIIAAGLVFQSFEVVEFYFQSQVLAKIVSICKVIQLALSSMTKIYLVLTEAELIYFVFVTAFDALSLAVSYFIAYKIRKNPPFYKHFDLSIAKQLLKDSWPLIITAISVMLYMKIDQIMIAKMLSNYAVGIYAAAVKITEAFYFIPMIVCASLMPALVKSRSNSSDLYFQRFVKLYAFLTVIAIVISLIIYIFADYLILFLYGSDFQEASPVLAIHIWATIFIFIGVASARWYMIENLQLYLLINTSLGALINIILNYIAIPHYGTVGAAVSTIISYAIATYFMSLVWTVSRGNFIRMNGLFISTFKKLNEVFNGNQHGKR